MSRNRNWCFTVNNYTECDENNVFAMSLDSEYLVCGKEVGECGTPHLQGFVAFKTLKSLSQMQEYIPGAHLEIKRGTFQQASDYCKKDNDFFEEGTLPMSQADKGDAEKRRWQEAFECVQEGRIADMDVQIKCTKLKSIEYAVARQRLSEANLENNATIEHMWIYGEPGCGKSFLGREECDQKFYLKNTTTKWWDDYQGQDNVMIEDFDKYQKAMGGDMKRWLDKYPFPAETKGGHMVIRPKKIVVTSNYHPRDIWDDDITVAAICRRVKVIHKIKPLGVDW